MPIDLTDARAAFERTWIDTGLKDRREIDKALFGKAFSLLIRSYRHQENGNPSPRLALAWADEMISHSGQVASRRELADAMLEKAAIYLEISQLHHTDRNRFNQISREGDKLLQDCIAIAEDDQKTEVLRYWSRFYYNLARPQSGRLSDRWDERFLSLADQRIDEALNREPGLLRNLNQKARVTQRRARATLDAPAEHWSDALWNVQRKFLDAWGKVDQSKLRSEEKISPLNVLAMTTLDAVMYTLSVSDDQGKKTAAAHLMKELESTAIPAQLNAWALIQNTDLARAYGFDTNYDFARLYALRGILSGILETGRQNEDIEATARYLTEARGMATVTQLDAAKASILGDPVFSRLPQFARSQLERALNGQM